MLVYSELKSAQLESSVGDPVPASFGRVYIDSTSTTAGIPKVYDGTAWRKLLQPFALYDNGNSGTSKTIDWSNGLFQKVTLSANCVLSFTNGQAGRQCILIVIQDQTVPYFYRLPADIHWKHGPVAPALIPPKSQNTLGFTYGLTTMVANLNIGTAAPNPPALPVAAVTSVRISPTGRFVAITSGTTPFLHVYQLIDGPIGPILGQRAANAATLPTGAAMSCDWSPNEDYLAVAHTTTPFVSVYPFIAPTLAIGAKITNPGSVPAGNGTAVAWSKLGDAIVVGCATTPFVASYPFSAGAFGTIHTAPVSTPSGTITAIDFMPIHLTTLSTSTFIALAGAVTPFISMYAYTAATGFGAISTAPVTLPAGAAGAGHSIAFSPNGQYLAIAVATNPFLAVYPVSQAGVFGVKIADPATVPAGAATSCQWTPDGDFLVVGHGTTPFNSWYPFTAGAFGIKLTDSSTLPPAAATDVSIAPNGETVIFGSGTTPFVKTYGGVRNAKNYINLVQ